MCSFNESSNDIATVFSPTAFDIFQKIGLRMAFTTLSRFTVKPLVVTAYATIVYAIHLFK